MRNKHNSSQDERISKRLYYDQLDNSQNQNSHYFWKHTLDNILNDLKSEWDGLNEFSESSKPIETNLHKLKKHRGHRASASMLNQKLVIPNKDTDGSKWTPITTKRQSGTDSTENIKENSFSAPLLTNYQNSSEKTSTKMSKYTKFYKKQLSFVENKFAWINKELHKRDK